MEEWPHVLCSIELEGVTAMTFTKDLEGVINRYSKENGSNTPDFILAEFLTQVLVAWDGAIRSREEWYGRGFSAGSLNASAKTATAPLTDTQFFEQQLAERAIEEARSLEAVRDVSL